MTLPAPTKWAQRKDRVLLTFEVHDCENAEMEFKPNAVIFKGKCKLTNASYKNEICTFDEIVEDECVWSNKTKAVECTLLKKNADAPFWPRLCKEKVKQHWLHVDFGKWKDEDDTDSEEEDRPMGGAGGDAPDLSQMMAQMARGNGTVDPNSMNDLPSDSDDDSDDEDLPELDTEEKSGEEATEQTSTENNQTKEE